MSRRRAHPLRAVAQLVVEDASKPPPHDCFRGEHFIAADIRCGVDDAPSRSTVYRVLDELAADNWIAQRGNGWAPVMKATMLGRGGDDDTNDNEGSFEIATDDLPG